MTFNKPQKWVQNQGRDNSWKIWYGSLLFHKAQHFLLPRRAAKDDKFRLPLIHSLLWKARFLLLLKKTLPLHYTRFSRWSMKSFERIRFFTFYQIRKSFTETKIVQGILRLLSNAWDVRKWPENIRRSASLKAWFRCKWRAEQDHHALDVTVPSFDGWDGPLKKLFAPYQP